jgi:hypothetical protein
MRKLRTRRWEVAYTMGCYYRKWKHNYGPRWAYKKDDTRRFLFSSKKEALKACQDCLKVTYSICEDFCPCGIKFAGRGVHRLLIKIDGAKG